MNRLLLACVFVFVALAVAPAANAQTLTTLYTTIDAPSDVQGVNNLPVGPSPLGTFRIATPFTPTASGDASLLSVRAQCVIPYPTGTTCQGIGSVSIQADQGGKPSGTSLGAMGFFLTDSTWSQPVLNDCGALSPRVHLNAGTKYWAVMEAPDQIGWLFWKQATGPQTLESIDGGAWTASPTQKTLALRIDTGFDRCVPKAKTIPAPGEELADMYVRTGATAFNTISLENTGVAPLTWSSAEFSGADASVFSLVDQLFNAPPRYPVQLGVGGALKLLEVRCTGGPQERWYHATLTLHTNDPDTPDLSFAVSCLVDNTPPNLTTFSDPPDGLNGWWVTPLNVNFNAIDPEPASGVQQSSCGRLSQGWQFYGGVQLLALTDEGGGDLHCSAVDRAGNGAGRTWTQYKIDTHKPIAQPYWTPGRTEDGWNNTPTSLAFQCEDQSPGSLVDLPATGGGSVSTETAGTGFESGGCTDHAGWVSDKATATVRIDMTRPLLGTGVTPLPNAAGWHRTDPTVTFACDDTGDVQSGIKTDTVADIAVTRETSGTLFASAGNCTDKAANEALAVAQPVKLDKTDPTTTVDSGPPAAASATSADIAFTATDDRSGVAGRECRLDDGDWSACASAVHYGDLADGPHTVHVRATDVAGNTDASPATHMWTVDTAAPDTTIDSSPNDPSRSTTGAFTYSGDTLGGTAIARYECRVDTGGWGACADPANLTDGEHTFRVRAVDAAGNVDDSPATRTWTVDTIAPETAIATGPDAIIAATAASFTYDGDALDGTAVTGYECRLDGAAWAPCADRYSDLAEGDHSLQARAIDAAGNRDGTPASHAWTVDSLAPDTAIGTGPDALTGSRSAEFGYSGDVLGGTAVARFECRLDDGDWGGCQTRYSELAGGEHTFRVRAIDAAGNRDGSPATHTWTIDVIPPQTTIDTGPEGVSGSRTAAFTFSGDPLGGMAVARYECRLDDAAWGACAASYPDLAAGEHHFHVRAIDGGGNVDDTPAARTWTIDLVAPTTRITGTPPARSAETDATFAFSADDVGGSAVDGFECRLDGAAYAPCESGVAYANLADGRHTFEVRATDQLGNVESPAVSYEWTVSHFFAVDDEATTREDVAITIDVGANDMRPGGGAVTLTADARSAEGGTVSPSGDRLRYVPPVDWSGTDRFAYTAARGGETATGTVTVHVLDVNDPPAFRAAAAIVVDEDSGPYHARWASGIGAGEPGQRVRFAVTTAKGALFSARPAVSPAGELTFTPAPDAYGSAAVEIRATDDGGATRTAQLTITVNPIDDAPTVTVARDVRCGRSDNGTFRLLVHDIDNDGSTIRVSGTSSSDRVGLTFGGSGTERTVSITRRRGLRRATVTIRLADGAHTFAIPVRLAVGTSGDDRIRGSAVPDLLFGLAGDDRISGRGGNDLICGGTGADRLAGGAGDDVVIGGRGDDLVGGGRGNDVVRGDTGADQLVGGPGDDILRGGPRADVFAPAPGADTLVDFNSDQGDSR